MPIQIVIETLPGRASAVAQRLMSVPGLMLRHGWGGSRLEGTWTASDGEPLERLWGQLAVDPDVLDIYPTAVLPAR